MFWKPRKKQNKSGYFFFETPCSSVVCFSQYLPLLFYGSARHFIASVGVGGGPGDVDGRVGAFGDVMGDGLVGAIFILHSLLNVI